jgi:hypothetical protein
MTRTMHWKRLVNKLAVGSLNIVADPIGHDRRGTLGSSHSGCGYTVSVFSSLS